MNLIFRKGRVEDSRLLAKYRVEFLNEVLGNNDTENAAQLEHELVEYFQEHIANGSLVVWLVEKDSLIISTSSMVIWSVPFGYSGLGKKGRRGYILNMYTLKAYRKMGLASKLLEKLIEEARILKLELLSLNATDDGIGVYKKIGFADSRFPELKLKINP